MPINRETTDAAQNWILHTQVAREIELSDSYDAIVCDRAVVDNYAYMVHAAGRRPELEPFIRHWMATYDLLVKVPVIAPPSFDGTRDTSVDFQMDIDALIPCGLIINELVSNAFKYAFPSGAKGSLHISIKPTPEGMTELVVRDDGPGLVTGFDISSTRSLGLRLVNSLVRQLKGVLEIKQEGGVEFRIVFSEQRPGNGQGRSG